MNKPEWYDASKAMDRYGKEQEWEELEPELQQIIYSQHHAGVGRDDYDILESMKKLQEMRESDEFCCIKIDSDYHFVWDISFVYQEKMFTTPESHKWRKIPTSFDRLSDAIREMYDLWKNGLLENDNMTIALKK